MAPSRPSMAFGAVRQRTGHVGIGMARSSLQFYCSGPNAYEIVHLDKKNAADIMSCADTIDMCITKYDSCTVEDSLLFKSSTVGEIHIVSHPSLIIYRCQHERCGCLRSVQNRTQIMRYRGRPTTDRSVHHLKSTITDVCKIGH